MGRLQLNEVFPAGVAGVRTRMLHLSTGVRLRVAEGGSSGGVPVVLLHGWASSMYMFRHAFSLLPPKGIRPIAVDLRGHGLSDHPRTAGAYSLESYLADLDALLDILGLDRVALIGQSMGGGIALQQALRRPERVSYLVLINPVGLVRIPAVSFVRTLPRRFLAVGNERLIPRWWARLILRHVAFGNPRAVSERDVDENWAMTQVAGFAYAVRACASEFDFRPVSTAEAARLAVPSLAIIGSEDRVIRGSLAAAKALNGSRVASFWGGHCIHEERPAEIYDLIGSWINGARRA